MFYYLFDSIVRYIKKCLFAQMDIVWYSDTAIIGRNLLKINRQGASAFESSGS